MGDGLQGGWLGGRYQAGLGGAREYIYAELRHITKGTLMLICAYKYRSRAQLSIKEQFVKWYDTYNVTIP